MEGIINDSLNTESDAQIIPSTKDGASGVTLLLTRLMADKENYTAGGELTISKTMLELFRILIRSEKKRDEKIQQMASRLDSLVAMQTADRYPNNKPHPAMLPTETNVCQTHSDKSPANC